MAKVIGHPMLIVGHFIKYGNARVSLWSPQREHLRSNFIEAGNYFAISANIVVSKSSATHNKTIYAQ
jgi:hypothetical protein